MKPIVALIALLAAVFTGSVRAASMAVVIEKLDANAVACGISVSQLENVATLALENDHVRPADNASGQLHVRVTVTQRNACFARISVQMKVPAEPPPPAGLENPKWPARLADAVLCDKGGNYSAPKESFSSEVSSVMEDYIKQCLGSLEY